MLHLPGKYIKGYARLGSTQSLARQFSKPAVMLGGLTVTVVVVVTDGESLSSTSVCRILSPLHLDLKVTMCFRNLFCGYVVS